MPPINDPTPPRKFHPKTQALLERLARKKAPTGCPECGQVSCYHCWECGADLSTDDHLPTCDHYCPSVVMQPCKACGGRGLSSRGGVCFPCNGTGLTSC